MDENTVVTATMVAADQKDGVTTVEAPVGAENAKTEPVKAEKTDTAEVEKLKAALSRANSQAAEYKRQRNEALDKSKLAEVERAEQEQAMREELETLRKEKDISDSVNRARALNMDADISQKLAEAWNAHNKDSMFDCLKEFVEAITTRLNNEALNRQPGLSAGIPPTKGTVNDEEYEKMRRYAGLSPHR
jgi:hypothetical protein